MNGVVAWTEGTWECGKYLSVFTGIDLILRLCYHYCVIFTVIESYACCYCLIKAMLSIYS